MRGQILQMFAALERVGATPIEPRAFHSFAFLANVLSSVWGFEPIDGSVLKDEGAPYFPELQREVDHLIGERFIIVHNLSLLVSGRIKTTFRLDHMRARPVLDSLATLPDQMGIDSFLIEVADAFADIDDDRKDDAASVDANYSDPAIATGRVVDFGQWRSPTEGNAAWVTAEMFQEYLPDDFTLNRAEKVNLYMQLMKQRAHG